MYGMNPEDPRVRFLRGLQTQGEGLYQMVRHPIDTGEQIVGAVGDYGSALRENPKATAKATAKALRDYGKKVTSSVGNVSEFAGENVNPFAPIAAMAAIAKPLRAVKALEEVADVAKAVPKSVTSLGTTKAAREAATAKRLTQQTAEAEALRAAGTDVKATRAKGAGKREKVDANVYRKLYEEQGLDPVMLAAYRGEHLKPQPGGGYAGAPRTVRTGAQLGGMRKGLDTQLASGAEALQYADPERVGTWYDRAKAGQAATNEPYQLPRSLEQHAVYSAGVAPEAELGFALRHGNAQALRTGEITARPAPAETLYSAVDEGREASLGHKIHEYGRKNDPNVVEDSPFGVNDFRMAQAFGYTDPTGKPWKAGVSPTMHPFMDAETALMVDRANQRGLGGVTDWTGAKVQEVPWVYNKAEDIYGRGKKGRFAGEGGQAAALVEANNTMADYLPKHTLSATHEAVPGANTGHMPQVAGLPFDERRAYGHEGRWDVPGAEGTISTPGGDVGAGNRDAIYSALRMRQLPSIESVGNYTNTAGALEQNPMTIARPLMDFGNVSRAGEAGIDMPVNSINAPTQAAMEAGETFRGVIDAQEAAAANLPVTMAGRSGKTHHLLEMDTPKTPEDMQAVIEALRGTGVDPALLGNMSATNRGVQLFTGFLEDPNKARRVLGQNADKLPGTLKRSGNEGAYLPAMSSAEEAGQGIATSRVLEKFAAAPEEAALGVGESEAVRRSIKQKMERDARMGGGRADIEKTRRFFSEADWPQAVAMMRKGMKPAAALAALGYSLEGMADENPQ